MDDQIDSSTPGQQLKAAREAKNWTIIELADRLNLKKADIMCIEQDDYSYVSALVYVRGHLRSYAKAVGLSAHEVLEAFDALGWQETRDVDAFNVEEIAVKRHVFSWQWLQGTAWVRWLALMLVVLMLILVGYWWHQQTKQTASVEQQAPVGKVSFKIAEPSTAHVSPEKQ